MFLYFQIHSSPVTVNVKVHRRYRCSCPSKRRSARLVRCFHILQAAPPPFCPHNFTLRVHERVNERRLVRSAFEMAKTKKRRVPSKTTNDDIEERPVKKSRHTISIANDVATIEVYEMDFELADDDMIQLQVNNLFILVPEQEEGHLLLNLDIKKRRISLSKRSSQDLEAHTVSSIQHHGTAAVVAPPTAPKFSQSRDESKCGFLKLPAELRDIIYSEVFVSKNKRRNWSDNEAPPKQGRRVDPWRVEDAALSASFLRTCRQVYNEGRKWLYSENEFRIGRDWRSRGSVWESKWSCLG